MIIYRGRMKRLWTYFFGYGTKMWPWHTNRLKKDIRKRLATEDYTCRLPKIKPRVRYKLTKYWYLASGMDKFVLVYA